MARARKSNIDTSAPATPTSEIQEAKNGFCQWTILGDNAFAPGHDTVHQLTLFQLKELEKNCTNV